MQFKAKERLIVWDKETNSVLAKFDKNGIFNSTDKSTTKKLKEAGFVTVGTDKEADNHKPEGDKDVSK